MSLFSTLGTGASGMGASSSSLSVIGDNIANVGTTGFKASRVTFQDLIPQAIGTAGGVDRMGRGALLGEVATQFEQGAISQTGQSLDMALSGRGWFPVRGDKETYYTRDGAFHLDSQGYVVSASGLNLQGYQAMDGTLTARTGDLQVDLAPLPQQATTTVTFDGMLPAKLWDGNTPYAALVKDGSTADFGQLNAAADGATSTTIYDSLGVPHDVTVFFEQTGSNAYSWSAVVDGSEVDFDGDGVPDGAEKCGFEIASGTVSFDNVGALTGFTQTATATPWNFPGAATMTFNLDIGLDAAGNPTNGGSLVQSGTEFQAASIGQDGYASAGLLDVRVDPDGTVAAVYDNGEERLLGAVAVAQFDAESGLDRVGGNLFRATRWSGDATLGLAGTAGRGDVISRALEASSVDLEDEFVAMIQAQRSYQANAGVIRTTDETLQELVNLV